MRVLRGRAATPDADREAVAAMLERAAETGEPGVRVWQPHRQVAFGRRDVRAADYEVARKVADSCGFEPVERSVGGRAVAYTGTTVAFAKVIPHDDMRVGMDDRYDETTRTVQRAIWRLGVPAVHGEPADSFCPGDYSLQRDGKLVGVAQRVQKGAALVSGVVVVRDHEEIAEVLDPVYAALDVPFDPESVGSLARGDGEDDPERVARTIEDLLVGDADHEIEEVGEDGSVPEVETGTGAGTEASPETFVEDEEGVGEDASETPANVSDREL